jgi:hypothetical protein
MFEKFCCENCSGVGFLENCAEEICVSCEARAGRGDSPAPPLGLLGKQRLDKRNRRLIDTVTVVSGLDVGLRLHGLPSLAFEPLSL